MQKSLFERVTAAISRVRPGVVWVGTSLALSPRMFAVVNVVAVGLWAVPRRSPCSPTNGFDAFMVGREHKRVSKEANIESGRHDPEPKPVDTDDEKGVARGDGYGYARA